MRKIVTQVGEQPLSRLHPLDKLKCLVKTEMGGMGPLPEGSDYKYIQVLEQLKAGMRNFADIGQVGDAGWTFFYKPAQDGEPAMENRNRCNKKTFYTD